MKPTLFLSVALCALTAATAFAATQPVPVGPRAGAHFVRAQKSQLLYNQNSNFGYAIVSQNFTSGSFGTTYNSAAADDFIIPDGSTWRVKSVDVSGLYFNGSGPAASQTVTFYTDKQGLPDQIRAQYTVHCTDSAGNFSCRIPGAHGLGVKLFGGTHSNGGRRHWLSVVANCSFVGGCGEWGWVENTGIQNDPAVWENPGGGFGTGCTKWGTTGDCLGSPYTGDFAYDLRGKKL